MGFREKSHITIYDFPNFIRIDLKGAYTKWDKGAIAETETFLLEDSPIKIAKAEFLIVNKLNKGGQIDIEDAYSVYLQNEKRLDKELLTSLAELLDAKAALAKFLLEAANLKDKFNEAKKA
ncbi:MAG: hypothetical protein ACFFBD_14435 [Candidatus Hodarchaeota archaeon]